MRTELLLKIPQKKKEKLQGLLGLAYPPQGWGMLFLDTPAIHMVGMRFPIDVVCLDQNYTVLGVLRASMGEEHVSLPGTKHILELAPGDAAKLHIIAGAHMSITSTADHK